MIDGTEHEVLDLLFDRPRSPTEVAEELGVSVQTASRTLRSLADDGYAVETRDGSGRGYKRYEPQEFARVFAGTDGRVTDRTFELTPEKRAVLSVWRVPQPEYHPVLLSYLFADVELQAPSDLYEIVGIVLYGSVARGDAQPDSDIDVLVVYERIEDTDSALDRPVLYGDNWLGFGDERVVDEKPFSTSEFREALDAGSQFLRTVLDEGIVIYDPEEVIRDAEQERAGDCVPQ